MSKTPDKKEDNISDESSRKDVEQTLDVKNDEIKVWESYEESIIYPTHLKTEREYRDWQSVVIAQRNKSKNLKRDAE